MKKDIFNIIVPLNCHGHRIDKFLQSQINKLSRTRLQTLIRNGQVKLNNTTINNPSKKIKEGDQIKIDFPPPFLIMNLEARYMMFAGPIKLAPIVRSHMSCQS